MKHICIGIGQTHVHNYESLLKSKILSKADAILVTGKGVHYDSTLWSETFISETSFDNTAVSKVAQVKSILNKVKAYKRIIQKLAHFRNQPVTICVAYIEDVLSNYMFFSFQKDAPIKIIEDGTLNYYKHTLTHIDAFKFKLKQLFSMLYGIPFKSYKGHSSGIDYDNVVAQYLTFPDLAFSSKVVKQLPVGQTAIKSLEDNLYIIGQEGFCNLIGEEVFLDSLKDYFLLLKQKPFYSKINRIYYKPHRNGVRLTQDFLQGYFPEKEVCLMEVEKTSEQLYFDDITCRYVSTFNSSTLLNICAKLETDDRKKVVFLVYPIIENELITLFKKLDFTFLK